MAVQVTMDKPFTGAVFAKMRYESCKVDVNNANSATLLLGFPPDFSGQTGFPSFNGGCSGGGCGPPGGNGGYGGGGGGNLGFGSVSSGSYGGGGGGGGGGYAPPVSSGYGGGAPPSSGYGGAPPAQPYRKRIKRQDSLEELDEDESTDELRSSAHEVLASVDGTPEPIQQPQDQPLPNAEFRARPTGAAQNPQQIPTDQIPPNLNRGPPEIALSQDPNAPQIAESLDVVPSGYRGPVQQGPPSFGPPPPHFAPPSPHFINPQPSIGGGHGPQVSYGGSGYGGGDGGYGGGYGGYGALPPARDCGVTDNGNGTITATVVIQTNQFGIPGLVTSMDQLYQVSCDYSKLRGAKILTNASLNVK